MNAQRRCKPAGGGFPASAAREAVRRALHEDVRAGDITTAAIARPADRLRGYIAAQASGVVAGLPVVLEVYRQLDRRVRVAPRAADGDRVRPGQRLAVLQGPAAAILTGERTALNFLGMLSGVATAAHRYAERVKGTLTQIYDTRKTVPGLRALVKYAVGAGGGVNHRQGLYDGILIKDNHIRLAGSVTEAVARVRRRYGRKYPVEVEVENLAELKEALAAGAEILLLDNLRGRALEQAVALARPHAELEISGGMDEAAVAASAHLGVDRISVGALTHSAPWLAMHMEME